MLGRVAIRIEPAEACRDLNRNRVFRLAIAAIVAIAATGSAAADCTALTNQTIRWLVPSKPGGAYDSYSRLLQPYLEQQLQAQIVIENRQQAGGIVAALTVRDAVADGKTLGIINAPGLLAAHMASDNPAPDPLQDFTIIARVASSSMFLFTGPDSGIADIHDLLQISATRPVVIGVRDLGSSSFFAVPIMASLLGLNYTVVTGYIGSTTRVLAAMRGEVDVIIQNLDSVKRYVDAGELHPLLQISGPAAHTLQATHEVPDLRRPGWLAQAGLEVSGTTATGADQTAAALSDIISAGRLIVAPAGLDDATRTCLQTTVLSVLQSVEFINAANQAGLTIQAADAATAMKGLQAGKRHMSDFRVLVRSAIEEARQ